MDTKQAGMFTGSGMPMRFADLDGTLIDCYQVTTQMPDESGITWPGFINTLLDNATGPNGYYGVFCANMHTDNNNPGDQSVVGSHAHHCCCAGETDTGNQAPDKC